MTKKHVFYAVIIIMLLLIAYYIYAFPQNQNNNEVADIEEQAATNNAEDGNVAEGVYQKETKKLIRNYLDLVNNDEQNFENIELIKQKLLELNVPTYFKALHLDLVLAMNKMQSYASTGVEEELLESGRIIELALNKYSWLSE